MKKRYDTHGNCFTFPAYELPKEEYSKIVSEINTNFSLYKTEHFAVHFTVGIDKYYYAYYFENHGFDDYNIYAKFMI